jgi:hypothetical protein
MKKLSQALRISGTIQLLLAALLAMGLAGCKKDGVRAYQAPQEAASPHSIGGAGQPMAAASQPRLEWKLPPGWQETGGDEVSYTGFTIAGPNGAEARVNITRLGNLSGKEAMLVNMWRQQASLEPLSEPEAVKAIQPIEFASGPGSVFEVLGTNQNQPVEIITAFAHRADGSWFCKLTGTASLVAAQKPAFIEFLKSLKIIEPSAAFVPTVPAAESPIPAVSAAAGKFNWQVPAQWQAAAAGQMQVARFSVAGAGGAKADVFVSVFDTDTGGNLANVNRWRGQIGLGAVEEKDLAQLVAPLDPAIPGSVLVDLSGKDKRLVGAIVPRDGKFWFYKLVGDAAAVAPAKEAYVTFAKSKP